ncbi:MAG: Wzz/FepE/Etk N-terminal domain-containing protein [Bacillota bacterium]|nr:Wzz/FepE/Etk N-terminal domain-containing protein [Bacillota bacterium]
MEPRYTEDEITIDIREIFNIIRKYILLILLIPIIAASSAGIAVFFVMDPVYKAETTLLVKNQTTSQMNVSDLQFSRQLVKTYREIARSRVVALEVIRVLNLNVTADQLRDMVDVALRGDTEIIAISVEHTDPRFAATLANAVAEAFRSNTIRIMQVENVTVVDDAVAPTNHIKPRKMLTIVIAGLAGGMAGAGAAFVLAYLDNTFKRPEDIQQHLGLPVLGTIPLFKQQDFTREGAGA